MHQAIGRIERVGNIATDNTHIEQAMAVIAQFLGGYKVRPMTFVDKSTRLSLITIFIKREVPCWHWARIGILRHGARIRPNRMAIGTAVGHVDHQVRIPKLLLGKAPLGKLFQVVAAVWFIVNVDFPGENHRLALVGKLDWRGVADGNYVTPIEQRAELCELHLHHKIVELKHIKAVDDFCVTVCQIALGACVGLRIAHQLHVKGNHRFAR